MILFLYYYYLLDTINVILTVEAAKIQGTFHSRHDSAVTTASRMGLTWTGKNDVTSLHEVLDVHDPCHQLWGHFPIGKSFGKATHLSGASCGEFRHHRGSLFLFAMCPRGNASDNHQFSGYPNCGNYNQVAPQKKHRLNGRHHIASAWLTPCGCLSWPGSSVCCSGIRP